MKLYYFNPNSYGREYFTVAENKVKAHEYLLRHLENCISSKKDYVDQYKEELEMWKKVNPMDATTFLDGYTLDEHEVGSVIKTELC